MQFQVTVQVLTHLQLLAPGFTGGSRTLIGSDGSTSFVIAVSVDSDTQITGTVVNQI